MIEIASFCPDLDSCQLVIAHLSHILILCVLKLFFHLGSFALNVSSLPFQMFLTCPINLRIGFGHPPISFWSRLGPLYRALTKIEKSTGRFWYLLDMAVELNDLSGLAKLCFSCSPIFYRPGQDFCFPFSLFVSSRVLKSAVEFWCQLIKTMYMAGGFVGVSFFVSSSPSFSENIICSVFLRATSTLLFLLYFVLMLHAWNPHISIVWFIWPIPFLPDYRKYSLLQMTQHKS